MAAITHIGEGLTREESLATLRKFFEALEPGLIVAEQCVLMGAIDAMQTVQRHAGPIPAAEQMIADCLTTLDLLAEVATAKGVRLLEMNLPSRRETQH
jgi:hypothetical protein